MPTPYYVYILASLVDPHRHYTGCTVDIDDRLRRHNGGQVPHTAKYAPWKVQTIIQFEDRDKARAFEKYLKSGSGRAFARRHF